MLDIDPLSGGRFPFFPNTAPLLDVSANKPLSPSDIVEDWPLEEATSTQKLFPIDSSHSWMPTRPTLTAPHSLPSSKLPLSDHRLLATTEETRTLGNQLLDTFSLRMQGVRSKIQELSAENIQKLKESAERASTSSFWSVLKKIATALLSAISIVFGVSLLAGGGSAFIGGAMITSGILSLANFAMTETGSWDWVSLQLSNGNEEDRKKMAWILPMAVGIIAGGIGLVGSVQGIVSGAIQFADKAILIAQSAFAIFDGVTTFGKGVADARLQWTQADLSLIQGNLTAERIYFDSIIKEIESSMNGFKAFQAMAKKTIQNITDSNVKLVKI